MSAHARAKKLLPAALALAGCSGPATTDAGHDDAGSHDAGTGTDAGTDAGYDAGVNDAGVSDAGTNDSGPADAGCLPTGSCTPYVNACGMNCGCIGMLTPDAGFQMGGYCDPDIGNPCPLSCWNPKEPDGGRQYMNGQPVCLC
ncbi:MAG: hypothetical protein JNK82_45910 [Myxococcaceae bacterium]|nr:hypothetical protein [Myxococcaceae bacterium]